MEEHIQSTQGGLNQATDHIAQASVQSDLDKKALLSTIDDLRIQLRGTPFSSLLFLLPFALSYPSPPPSFPFEVMFTLSLLIRILYIDKQAVVEECDRHLKELCVKFDGDSAATQEKLNSAFEIASSLRKLLDDKELHVQQLLSLKVTK